MLKQQAAYDGSADAVFATVLSSVSGKKPCLMRTSLLQHNLPELQNKCTV